jgi:hypothetical protein
MWTLIYFAVLTFPVSALHLHTEYYDLCFEFVYQAQRQLFLEEYFKQEPTSLQCVTVHQLTAAYVLCRFSLLVILMTCSVINVVQEKRCT